MEKKVSSYRIAIAQRELGLERLVCHCRAHICGGIHSCCTDEGFVELFRANSRKRLELMPDR